MLEDRGASPKEGDTQFRECEAVHEEYFLSSWLREDVGGVTAEVQWPNEEANQEESKSVKREVEREEERVEIKRRCWKAGVQQCFRGPASIQWMKGRVMGIPWAFSVCVLALSSFVTAVTVVLVSPSDVECDY